MKKFNATIRTEHGTEYRLTTTPFSAEDAEAAEGYANQLLMRSERFDDQVHEIVEVS